MSTIQWYDARVTADALRGRLTAVVDEHADRLDAARLRQLLAHEPGTKPHLVLTGQYSSGKSTLIKALTDGAADVVIAADVATDRVTEYDWGGAVTLVDTPGVGAGLPRHDRLALDAIATGDLVLFVITPELFDDEGKQLLRTVATSLGKARQLLIVVNKARTMRGDPAIREEAVRQAWGTELPLPPILQCDAKDYLDGLAHPDPERAALYLDGSGIRDLRAAIDDVARQRGDLARLQQPLQAIRAVVVEVRAALADDPEEAAALTVLARERRALSTRRQRIEVQLQGAETEFLDDCLRVAEAFADSVDEVDDADDDTRQDAVNAARAALESGIDAAAARLGSVVSDAVSQQMQDLASELREIEASPSARLVLNLPVEADVDTARAEVDPRVPGRTPTPRRGDREWIEQVQQALAWFNANWGAGGGLKVSTGTLGHDTVLTVGRLFGHKFRPWGAVRVANRIGQAAKVASIALPIAIAIVDGVMDERRARDVERERHRRRQGLIDEVIRQARDIAGEKLGQARAVLDPAFAAAYRTIDDATDAITTSQASRGAGRDELDAIDRDAADALTRLTDVTQPVA